MRDDAVAGERRMGKQAAATAEQTKQHMIEVALRVFAVRGFEGTSLRDIAATTGTTHGLIRHYFGTKDGLWQAAIDHAIARYAAALAPHMSLSTSEQADLLATVHDGIRTFLHVSAQYPEIIRILMHEGAEGGERLNYTLTHLAPVGARMAPLLQALHARGYLQQFDDRTFFLFLLTAGAAPFALAALTNWLIADDITREAQVAHHVERIMITLFSTERPRAVRGMHRS